MDEKRKKLLLFGGAIFIGIIFVTSYLAFSNNNNSGGTTSSTTIPSKQTVVVTGTANGVIVNYTDIAYMRIGRGSSTNTINGTLNSLEANGSISNYVNTNNTYEVLLASISPYQLYQKFSEMPNITVAADAYVRLPEDINMYYGTRGEVAVVIPRYNYSVLLNNTLPINSIVPLRVTALVTTNGSIYNNQLELGVANG